MSDVRVPPAVRRRVAVRARHRCEYCRCPEQFSTSAFCIEHIVPSSRGGGSEAGNLAFACSGCNAHKSDRLSATDPLTDDDVRLFHPRQDRWETHFEWSQDFLEVIGLTKIGRATVATLQLNRRNIRNLRRLLLTAGEHPPE
jgi:hypothetical protein